MIERGTVDELSLASQELLAELEWPPSWLADVVAAYNVQIRAGGGRTMQPLLLRLLLDHINQPPVTIGRSSDWSGGRRAFLNRRRAAGLSAVLAFLVKSSPGFTLRSPSCHFTESCRPSPDVRSWSQSLAKEGAPISSFAWEPSILRRS